MSKLKRVGSQSATGSEPLADCSMRLLADHRVHLRLGISSFDKRQQRKEWLNPPPGEYAPIDGADHWEKTGEGLQLVPQPMKMKLKVD